jgi:hypothetical protein
MLPHQELAGQSWSPWRVKDKEVLERVQQTATGMVSGLRSGDHEERIKQLAEGRRLQDMMQKYEILQGYNSIKVEQGC